MHSFESLSTKYHYALAKVHEHLFVNNSDNLKWQTAFHISKCQWKTDAIIFREKYIYRGAIEGE